MSSSIDSASVSTPFGRLASTISFQHDDDLESSVNGTHVFASATERSDSVLGPMQYSKQPASTSNLSVSSSGTDAVHQVEFLSLQAQALLRLIKRLTATLLHADPYEGFNMYRYRHKYAAIVNDTSPAREVELMRADSDEDRHFVQIIAVCFNHVAFALLRALATVRIFGNENMQTAGLLGILRSDNLLTPFLKLTSLIYYNMEQYKGEKVSGRYLQMQDVQEQQAVINIFVSPAAKLYEADSSLTEYRGVESIHKDYIANFESKQSEEAALKKIEWTSTLTLLRLIFQAARAQVSVIFYLEYPHKTEEVNINDENETKRKKDKAAAENKTVLLINSLQYKILTGGLTTTLTDNLFELAGPIRTAMTGVLTEVARTLDRSDQDTLLAQLAESPLAIRVKFAEAVALTQGRDQAVANRADARKVLMTRMQTLRAADVQSIISYVGAQFP